MLLGRKLYSEDLFRYLSGLSVSAMACSNSDLVSFNRPFSLQKKKFVQTDHFPCKKSSSLQTDHFPCKKEICPVLPLRFFWQQENPITCNVQTTPTQQFELLSTLNGSLVKSCGKGQICIFLDVVLKDVAAIFRSR